VTAEAGELERRLAVPLTDDARSLAARLWPGDLTRPLPWKSDVPPIAAVDSTALVGCPDGALGRLLALTGELLGTVG
jgi:tRNA A37 threonylcarbamoyladenosine synthetase subunit TsaC/SUA5/YrdC